MGSFLHTAHAYLKTTLLLTIPPECFYPKPKIDSAVIEMIPLQNKNWCNEDEILFRQVIRASFSNRRKTLNNSLRSFLSQKSINREQFKAESAKKGIDLQRRAETLSCEEFYKLSLLVKKFQ